MVLVPLFGTVDLFMFRPYFATLMGVRVVSCLLSALILLLLRRPLGRRYPSWLAIILGLEIGLAIAGVPVFVTGADTPYVSMALLMLSLAALFPWTVAYVALLSAALAAVRKWPGTLLPLWWAVFSPRPLVGS